MATSHRSHCTDLTSIGPHRQEDKKIECVFRASEVGRVFQAAGVALPSNWREHTA